MKLIISLILIGIIQIAAGGFYGLLAPIRIEENIQSDLNRTRSAAEERIREKMSPEFAKKWPEEFKSEVLIEMREAESLARSSREGWKSLETTSCILAFSGLTTALIGVSVMLSYLDGKPSEPAGTGQPMQPARKSENHLNH
jgi:hypothetical protein